MSDGVAVARYARIAKEVAEMTERDAMGNMPLWYIVENWRASVVGSAWRRAGKVTIVEARFVPAMS